MGTVPVYAEPVESPVTESTTEKVSENVEAQGTNDEQANTDATQTVESKSCQESLGALGWLVCPATGKVSEAVDFLYDKIEEVLVINPATMEDGQPIYEIWKYMRGVTNILFIIFLLVMVYSQLTGAGINNYGLKKTLPKLIVGAILVNLSFVICSLAVDASNIIGESLRGLFETIETNTLATTTVSGAAHVSMAEMYAALSGGTGLAIGAGVVAFEAGAIWMLIPTVLGAIAAVVIGLITIALRQAVVAILIMIAPLAVMAYILPNTEKWFRQWKDLLFRMLVFYPMFSLLFGASSLAGWAIIVSATSGFWVLVGVLIQVMPLVLSWSLMKMSGTFLSNVNAKLSSMVAKPLAVNRGWAESRRELTRQKYLASRDVFTPSLRLTQFLSDRRVAREEETKEHAETVKLRGQAYAALRNYRSRNMKTISREGEEAYEAQYRRVQYQQTILRHKNNFDKGIGGMGVNAAQNARLEQLDNETIRAFDKLKMEQARTEKIDYDNAVGFHKRMEDAMNAHFDSLHVGEATYKRHDIANRLEAESRYATALGVMDGNLQDTQYTAAFAAHAYDTQAKTIATKYQKYFELTPPTRDVEYRLGEITKMKEAADLMDAIIPGLRVLNMRGDTDLVRKQMMNFLRSEANGGESVIQLGTHASQALASFLMFEVKDNDPWLRRFGKYINLETAHVYNKNDRQKMTVDYDEYVKGYYYEPGDPHDKEHRKYAKKGMKVLMEGTSLDGIERTAMDNFFDSVMDAYTDKDGTIHDYDEFEETLSGVNNAIAPQLISAMRKTLSGSEALVSMVKSVTGYGKKQKEDGSYELQSIFDDEKLQKRFGENIGDYKAYRKKWAKDYLKALLPSQVLSMRTDELVAYEKLLPEWFIEEHPDLHNILVDTINEKYSDLSDEEKSKLLTTVEDREMFRQCIDMGVLEQISRTNKRRGVLDSKPKLRNFLGLDGDDGSERSGLSKFIAEKSKIKKEKIAAGAKNEDINVEEKEADRILRELQEIYNQRNAANNDGDKTKASERVGLFSSAEIGNVLSVIGEIYNKLEKDNDANGFFNAVCDIVGENAPIVLNDFKEYYEKHNDAKMPELLDEITKLLSNLL
ncbi:MFS transporter [Candidatus Saccharibacteria bacterium]|nr:MFS transporter [Candidatus Saccharibacteria bacterium]